jgi:TorA maturation chaperone TorD
MKASEAVVAARFSAAFFFAHDLLRAPSAEQWRRLGSAQIEQVWSELAGILDPGLTMGLPDSYEVFSSEYRAAFSTGGIPHVPLAESAYARPEKREGIIRENLLFYDVFGLRAPEGSSDPPDHLRRQLEFVGLCYRMESREREGESREEVLRQIRAARREFLARHLLNWLPEAAERSERGRTAWVRSFLHLLLRLAQASAEETEAASAPGAQGEGPEEREPEDDYED